MANQINQKTIKNYKRRTISTRRQLHEFVKAMGEEARGGEVEEILLDQGMSPCVAREWGNVHRKKDVLLKRTMARKFRKETSAYGKRGESYRRIINTGVRDGRRFEYHATKGLRTYRIPLVSPIAIAEAEAA